LDFVWDRGDGLLAFSGQRVVPELSRMGIQLIHFGELAQ
jgi:hypothetical protein